MDQAWKIIPSFLEIKWVIISNQNKSNLLLRRRCHDFYNNQWQRADRRFTITMRKHVDQRQGKVFGFTLRLLCRCFIKHFNIAALRWRQGYGCFAVICNIGWSICIRIISRKLKCIQISRFAGRYIKRTQAKPAQHQRVWDNFFQTTAKVTSVDRICLKIRINGIQIAYILRCLNCLLPIVMQHL